MLPPISKIEAPINEPWRANYSGMKSTCRVVGDHLTVTVYYPRNTKLGRRIAAGVDGVRPVLANYLRQDMGMPRGQYLTVVLFVGV